MERGGRLAYLDGVRGVAILAVLIAHFVGVQFIDAGRFGVDLFFVLSGLLMSRILFEQRMPIDLFYRRRISRIMPAFFAFLFIVAGVWRALGHAASWQELVTFASFTRTYYLHPTIWQSAIPVENLWSLNVEEHCYLLLALIAAIAALRKRATWVLFALAAATLLAIELHMRLRDHGPYELNTECASTALLCSAAYRTVAHRFTAPRWLPLTCLLLAGCCYLHGAPWYARVAAAPVLLALFVNHVEASPRWAISALETRGLCWIGVLSYSIYLWQQPFYRDRAAFPLHSAVLFAVLAGCASYYLLENPARRWLNAHWGAKPRERAPIRDQVLAAAD